MFIYKKYLPPIQSEIIFTVGVVSYSKEPCFYDVFLQRRKVSVCHNKCHKITVLCGQFCLLCNSNGYRNGVTTTHTSNTDGLDRTAPHGLGAIGSEPHRPTSRKSPTNQAASKVTKKPSLSSRFSFLLAANLRWPPPPPRPHSASFSSASTSASRCPSPSRSSPISRRKSDKPQAPRLPSQSQSQAKPQPRISATSSSPSTPPSRYTRRSIREGTRARTTAATTTMGQGRRCGRTASRRSGSAR